LTFQVETSTPTPTTLVACRLSIVATF